MFRRKMLGWQIFIIASFFSSVRVDASKRKHSMATRQSSSPLGRERYSNILGFQFCLFHADICLARSTIGIHFGNVHIDKAT